MSEREYNAEGILEFVADYSCANVETKEEYIENMKANADEAEELELFDIDDFDSAEFHMILNAIWRDVEEMLN